MHSTERVVGNVTQKTQIEIIPPPIQWRKTQKLPFARRLPPSKPTKIELTPIKTYPPNFLRIILRK